MLEHLTAVSDELTLSHGVALWRHGAMVPPGRWTAPWFITVGHASGHLGIWASGHPGIWVPGRLTASFFFKSGAVSGHIRPAKHLGEGLASGEAGHKAGRTRPGEVHLGIQLAWVLPGWRAASGHIRPAGYQVISGPGPCIRGGRTQSRTGSIWAAWTSGHPAYCPYYIRASGVWPHQLSSG